MVEPSMIGLREGKHKLTGPLIDRVDIDARLSKLIRWHESYQLKEEIRLAFK